MNEIVNVFKILSDETRLRMLMILSREELCVCEISNILGVSQPTISKNLSRLKDLGFVLDQRRDKYVFYSLNVENTLLNNTLDNIGLLYNQSQVLINDEKKLNDGSKRTSKCFTN